MFEFVRAITRGPFKLIFSFFCLADLDDPYHASSKQQTNADLTEGHTTPTANLGMLSI